MALVDTRRNKYFDMAKSDGESKDLMQVLKIFLRSIEQLCVGR